MHTNSSITKRGTKKAVQRSPIATRCIQCWLLAILLLPSMAQAQKKFTIKGKIAPVPAPNMVYLYYTKDGQKTRDSSSAVNGTFTFTGEISEPLQAMFGVEAPKGYETGRYVHFRAWLEPGVMKITSKDSLMNAVAKGGPVNQDYQSFKDTMAALSSRKAKTDFFYEAHKDFIRSHPASIVSVDILQAFERAWPGIDTVEALYNTLAASVQQTKAGKLVGQGIRNAKATEIGRIAPNFTAKDTAGNTVALADFRGKYVLVDFWASWCIPCRKENPAVIKAYNTYKEKNFTVVGLSIDKASFKPQWLKAIADDGLPWPQLIDESNEATTLYNVKSIPQNFLIDPNGKIIAKNLRGEGLDKLKDLLP